MKRHFYQFLCIPFFVALIISCNDENETTYQAFDPSKPIEITGFYPDSGGVATPFIS